MYSDYFDSIVTVMLERQPFRVFTIKLKTGELVEIDHLKALHLIGGVAEFTAPGKIAVMFDSDSVIQVIDEPASDVANASSR